MAGSASCDAVELGQIVGVHGLQGWLKLRSYCDPREEIFCLGPLLVDGQTVERFVGKAHGKGLLIRFEDYPDRTSSEQFVGSVVSVPRSQMPRLQAGQYYWRDLEGLLVVNRQGEQLGRVDHLLETGTHDVLVVAAPQPTMIPFVPERYVLAVDLEGGQITVDWSADWV